MDPEMIDKVTVNDKYFNEMGGHSVFTQGRVYGVVGFGYRGIGNPILHISDDIGFLRRINNMWLTEVGE